MRKVLLVVLIFGFLFSGCDGISGMQNGFFGIGGGSATHSNGGVEVDNTGTGLVSTFSIDTKNIKTGRLLYEVSLENSGIEPIELTNQNFKLKLDRNYDDKSIITQESIDAFYTKILGVEGKIKLYQNMDFKQGGVLKIDEDFLKSTISNFKILLEVIYPYKTEFITNLDLGVEYGMHKINSGASFEQASPIQVNNLILTPDYKDGEYILEVEINDKGDRGSVNELKDAGIEIKNFEIKFGSNPLSCSVKPEVINGVKSSSMKVKRNSKLTLECPVKIDSKDPFVTQVTGSFSFDYVTVDEVSVTIPKDVVVK